LVKVLENCWVKSVKDLCLLQALKGERGESARVAYSPEVRAGGAAAMGRLGFAQRWAEWRTLVELRAWGRGELAERAA